MSLDRVKLFHSFYYIGPANALDLPHHLSIHASLSCSSVPFKVDFLSDSHSCPNRSHACHFPPYCQFKTWFTIIVYFRVIVRSIFSAKEKKEFRLCRKSRKGKWICSNFADRLRVKIECFLHLIIPQSAQKGPLANPVMKYFLKAWLWTEEQKYLWISQRKPRL